ncbi:hypothetical protein ACU686_20715 [Yinghuangia aomiensis]
MTCAQRQCGSLPLSDWIQRNAVRVYTVAAAVLALVAHYYATTPTTLILAVAGRGPRHLGGPHTGCPRRPRRGP